MAARKRKKILSDLSEIFFMRFIKSQKFDMLSINFRKDTKYFLKVKTVFSPRSVYPKRERQLGARKGLFFN